jgi:hypothetical protein
MAHQNNLLQFSGSVGEMVHYERSDQFFTYESSSKCTYHYRFIE